MEIIKNPKPEEWDVILKRPTQNSEALNEVVNDVFEAVQNKGDNALKHYTKTFDKVDIYDLKVSKSEIESAEKAISPELKKAIKKQNQTLKLFIKPKKPVVLMFKLKLSPLLAKNVQLNLLGCIFLEEQHHCFQQF